MTIRFKNPFKQEPSIEELQQREERSTLELSIAQKQTLIKELEAKGRKWQEFSNNGARSGIAWDKIKAFIKGSKGGKSV